MSEVTQWLDQAQARADISEPGPWEADKGLIIRVVYEDRGEMNGTPVREPVVYPIAKALALEAEFIAAARTDLPAALAALRAVLNLVDTYTERDWGDREWGDVPGWRLRDEIATALGVSNE